MRHVMRDYRSYYTVQPLGTKLRNRSHFLSIQTLLIVGGFEFGGKSQT